MPFKSKAQMKACFATHGFNGKIDCDEWAHATNNLKSLPDKKQQGGYSMYRPKKCKKCGDMTYQMGGPTAQQLATANKEAKRFALARHLVSGENTNVGNSLPQYVDTTGRPYHPNVGVTNSYVPEGITRDMIQANDQGIYSYPDPITGDLIPVNSSVLSSPRFQFTQTLNTQSPNNANYQRAQISPSLAMRMYGGYQRMQTGGLTGFNNPLANQQAIPGVNAPYPDFPVTAQTQTPQDPVQQLIYKGLLDTPPGYDSPQQWYADMSHPAPATRKRGTNLQNLGIGMMYGSDLLGEISGRVERGRQNQYDYQQQSALGMMNPQQASDFQPTPYSLYAKYGGKLKHYMPKHHDMMDMDHDGMAKGGKWIQNAVNPSHKGWCTPLSNPHCTGHRRALALRFKHGLQEGGNMPDEQMMNEMQSYAEGGRWLQGAVNPEHKGWCTPLSNPHCTGRRRQFALMMKEKHGFHQEGGIHLGIPQAKKGGIYIKPENRGKFTEYCGGKVTEECIQRGLHSPSATIRKRANFARNARTWN